MQKAAEKVHAKVEVHKTAGGNALCSPLFLQVAGFETFWGMVSKSDHARKLLGLVVGDAVE